MRNHRSDESGAVAVIVAIFVGFSVLGLAAVTIDLGSLWQSQRALVTDTDAMSLAGAEALGAFDECRSNTGSPQYQAVRDAVVDVGAANGVDASDIQMPIEIRCQGEQWIVEVRANEDSSGWFSGNDDLSALGVSTAVKSRTKYSNLAFCRNYLEDLDFDESSVGDILTPEDWEDLNYTWESGEPIPGDVPNGVAFHMPYKTNFNAASISDESAELGDAMCDPGQEATGQLPGAWGWLDGEGWEGDDAPFHCGATATGTPGNWCDGDTGTNDMNQWPINRNDYFTFPVFDEAIKEGGERYFQVTGVAQAILVGCSNSGGNSISTVGESGFTLSCGANAQYISLIITGYADLSANDFQDYMDQVNPSSRICGVRGNDGECV